VEDFVPDTSAVQQWIVGSFAVIASYWIWTVLTYPLSLINANMETSRCRQPTLSTECNSERIIIISSYLPKSL